MSTNTDNNDITNQSDDQRLMTLMSQLTVSQIRFVAARLNTKNDRAAAEAIGISPKTAYGWSKHDKAIMNEIQRLQLDYAAATARGVLQRYALEAAILKVQALLGETAAHDKYVQDAATEILDRVMGKPRQSVEVSGDSDAFVPKTYVTISPDMWDKN